MRRAAVSPAFAGSLALHLALLLAALVSWRFAKDLNIGSAVPVTIVANAPTTDLRAAEAAPEPQTAQTETPQPQAPPEVTPPPQLKPVAPPPPTPLPTPPKPPVPTSTPKPAPAKPQTPPKPAEKSFDLDALAASVSKATQPAKPSSAARGPARPETAQQARPDAGSGLSAAAVNGLAAELQRRWNPNCDVAGGREVQVRVTFQLGLGGNVVGEVTSQIRGGGGPVAQAAAERAVRAVYAAAPFRSLPRDVYGQRISVNFNAREACS